MSGAADQDVMTNPTRPRGWVRLAVQSLGFLAGLGLLAWCGYSVFSRPEAREQLSRLTAASWQQVAGLLALSGATIVFGGLMFWAVVRPVRQTRALDQIAVNGVCTVLGYVPFKLSFIFRVVYQNRREGMPLLFIGGWMAACAAVIAACLAPPVAMSLLLKRVDALWWAGSLGGVALAGAALIIGGRWASGPGGRAWIDRAAGAMRLGRLARSEGFGRLMEGCAMLADWRATFGGLVLRGLDVAAQAARFWLGAGIIGVAITPDQAILAGATYFLLQVLAPTGVGGVREAGTAGVLGFLGQDIMVVVLAVSAGEAVMNLVFGAAGAAWLRVDRLLSRRGTGDAPAGA